MRRALLQAALLEALLLCRGLLIVGVCNDMQYNPLMPLVALAYEDMRSSGQPLIQLPRTSSDQMQVQFVFRDEACDPEVANQVGLEFLKLRVNAVLGCRCSSSSEVMARIGSIGRIPQISWISRSYYFTANHQYYRYFMRTVRPLGGNQILLVDLLQHFRWRHAKFFHLTDRYGGMYDDDLSYETMQVAQARGIAIICIGLAVTAVHGGPAAVNGACPAPWQLSPTAAICEDLRPWRQAVHSSRRQRGLINLVYASLRGDSLMRVARDEGLLQELWIFADPGVFLTVQADVATIAQLGGCLGIGLDPARPGTELYERFMRYWQATANLSTYQNRLPQSLVALLQTRQLLGPKVQADFLTYSTATLIDALSTIYLAFDQLLGSGRIHEENNGLELLEAMLNASFHGASGLVYFDDVGDIVPAGLMDVWNLQGGQKVYVASWGPAGIAFKAEIPIVWPSNATIPPSDMPPACAEGLYFDGIGCAGCGQGRQPSLVSGEDCALCPNGTAGTNLCVACGPGSYANQTGLVACYPCPPGFQCGESRTEAPKPCQRGSSSPSSGSVMCSDCPSGTYTDQEAQTGCSTCAPLTSSRPWLWKTMKRLQGMTRWVPFEGATSAAHCGCQEGAYMADGECIPCSTGMACPGMGGVQLLPGYASLAAAPEVVFQCLGERARCPGGPPGTCAANRNPASLACTACLAGTRAGRGGACEACRGADYLMVIAAGVAAFALLCCTYRSVSIGSRVTQGRSTVLMAVATAQLVTVSQNLGVLNLMWAEWPQPFASVFSFFSVLNLDLDTLRLDCVEKLTSAGLFAFRVFFVLGLFAAVALIHSMDVVIFYGGRFRERRAMLIGSMGTIFMSCLVSIVASLAAPLQCQAHPNGLSTVRAYGDVVCWSGAFESPHREMVLMSLFACSLPTAFVAGTVMVLRQLPAKVREGSVEFLRAVSFLLFRFRTGMEWYVLVFIMRNFLLALTPIIPDTAAQIFFMYVTVVAALMVAAHVSPWRVREAHVLDILANLVVLTILLVAAFCIDKADQAVLMSLCCGLLGMVIMAIAGVAARGLYGRFARARKPYQFFICHHKAGAGNLARLLKMQLQEHTTVRRKVFVDSDDLGDLSTLFAVVQGDADKLLVLCSKDVLLRVWCIGEISAAFANKVPLVRVQLPEFTLPDAAFIDGCREHIGDILSLAQHGISTQLVQDTLRWFVTTTQVFLNCRITLPAMTVLVTRLVSRREPSQAIAIDEQQAQAWLNAVESKAFEDFIVADQSSTEAASAACVLKKLLGPLVPIQRPWKVPQILEDEQQLPDSARQVVLVCTNGVFRRVHVLASLVKAWELGATVLPVVSESSYRFPTRAFYDDLRAESASMLGSIGNPCQAEDLVHIVQKLFLEIAVEVNPQDSETVLQVRAHAVANRLTNQRIKVARIPPAVSTPDSSSKINDGGEDSFYEGDVVAI